MVLGPGQTINVWQPNTIKHCLVTRHANVEVSGQTVENMFDQTQMKQLIQAAEQAWHACPHQLCSIRDCPNEQNIAHQTREQKKCFTHGIECLMAFKFYQTRPNTIKHIQTRSNSTKQGVQTLVTKQCLIISNMFDTIRAVQTNKTSPIKHEDKTNIYVFDRMFDDLQILSNTTKHDQTAPNKVSKRSFVQVLMTCKPATGCVQLPHIMLMCLFLSEFDVAGDSQECPDNSDYARVFDGLASWSPTIGDRYCGSVIPSSIESKTNKLRIEFRSNGQYAGQGFDAVFTVESDKEGIDNDAIEGLSLAPPSWFMSHDL